MLNYPSERVNIYKEMLENTGALSKLFSESESPYLVSRSTENIYCEGLKAENLSRSDCTADAKFIDPEHGNIGIGIKTFLHNNGRTLQKVAEFNKQTNEYRDKNPRELVKTVAELRNKRILFTNSTHDLSRMIYHCVTRSPGMIHIYELPMDLIDIPNIKNVTKKATTIFFEDGRNEYSFSLSKSTLLKRFDLNELEPILEFPVNIIEHPYLALSSLGNSISNSMVAEPGATLNIEKPYVILPLFSDRGERSVPERSGLNQWNANGRARDADEIYIPIPAWIHTSFPDFFPERDVTFTLQLPDNKELSTKVCQEGRKALMSNPNKDLGKWLLRQVFNLEERELLTYQQLIDLDIDSVRVTKHSDDYYQIDFCQLGTYDDFKEQITE